MSSKDIIFNRLPAALIRLISEYTNVAPLFTTCKELWNGDVRKEVVYLSLKDKDVAMRFYRDDAFRIYVYSRVQNPSRQISLELGSLLSPDMGSAEFQRFHFEILKEFRVDVDVTDVSALGNVHTLRLYNCRGVTDVSALGNVHNLLLYRCFGVNDVSALGKVHTLDLSRCSGVTDVSVHTLTLRR